MTDAEPRHVEIYADGACKGNPGLGGWGALLRWGDHERPLYGGAAATTNNRMELTAVIESLKALKRPCEIDLYTDSQYVQRGITEWLRDWKRRGWKTASGSAVKNRDLWEELDSQAARHRVRWHWVKGHAGHPGNEEADRLANLGAQQAMQERGS